MEISKRRRTFNYFWRPQFKDFRRKERFACVVSHRLKFTEDGHDAPDCRPARSYVDSGTTTDVEAGREPIGPAAYDPISVIGAEILLWCTIHLPLC